MADTYCSWHNDMKHKIINIFKCIKEQMPRNRAGWGWEAGWGKYAWRNAQIQMGVSKTCWRGWGLSDFWKNAVSELGLGLGLGFVIKSWALQKQQEDIKQDTSPSGRWGSNNHETIFVGECEWKLFIYSFILMLIMAFLTLQCSTIQPFTCFVGLIL